MVRPRHVERHVGGTGQHGAQDRRDLTWALRQANSDVVAGTDAGRRQLGGDRTGGGEQLTVSGGPITVPDRHRIRSLGRAAQEPGMEQCGLAARRSLHQGGFGGDDRQQGAIPGQGVGAQRLEGAAEVGKRAVEHLGADHLVAGVPVDLEDTVDLEYLAIQQHLRGLAQPPARYRAQERRVGAHVLACRRLSVEVSTTGECSPRFSSLRASMRAISTPPTVAWSMSSNRRPPIARSSSANVRCPRTSTSNTLVPVKSPTSRPTSGREGMARHRRQRQQEMVAITVPAEDAAECRRDRHTGGGATCGRAATEGRELVGRQPH